MYSKELSEMKYTIISETSSGIEKQNNWNIAFGLQEVDRLQPSEYMISLAKENILGKLSYDDVEKNIASYYQSTPPQKIDVGEKQADEVSIKIMKILNDNAFTFNYLTLKDYHKKLFTGTNIGINPRYIGNFRDYNISKNEPILNGKSVYYADHTMIIETLKYDFDEESQQKYTNMSQEQMVKRLTEFTSRIWQVHPFGEGNTRTTAVFIQKYLNSKGFDVNNTLFKDNSLYFRNALVRANYSNYKLKIESDSTYLIKFFENLLCCKNNTLDNSKLYLELSKSDNIQKPSYKRGLKH